MTRDILERLTTDRAVGALTPDVEHLLEAYLKLDSASARTADEIGQTIHLAREALAEKVPSSMPAFPVAGFMQIERWRRRVRQFTYAAGLAACLSLGLGLGRLTAPAPVIELAVADAPDSAQVVPGNVDEIQGPQASTPTELVRSTSPQDMSSGFWDVDRLRQLREQDRPQSRPQAYPGVRIQWPGVNWPT